MLKKFLSCQFLLLFKEYQKNKEEKQIKNTLENKREVKVLNREKKKELKKSFKLITHTDPKSPISEQYRMLRTNIEYSSIDREIKTILVTSPSPEEGKSTTAVNLAIVLAQQEKKVLLVDADLRRPSVHYAFNSENLRGLTSVLAKQTNIENTISRTDIKNLHILTSGPIPPSPSDLLDSKAMESMLGYLNSKFDYIIFDTPPALAVTDSQILANKCDGIVMVLKSRKTSKEAAIKTQKLLTKGTALLLGVVLNEVTPDENNPYYVYK